jgi:hypothetical protein
MRVVKYEPFDMNEVIEQPVNNTSGFFQEFTGGPGVEVTAYAIMLLLFWRLIISNTKEREKQQRWERSTHDRILKHSAEIQNKLMERAITILDHSIKREYGVRPTVPTERDPVDDILDNLGGGHGG